MGAWTFGAQRAGRTGGGGAGGGLGCRWGVGRRGAGADERPGVSHACAGGRGDAGDEADDGFLQVRLAPDRGLGLVGPADLADHDDGVGVRVVVEGAHHVDVLQAIDRVAANADGGGLAQTDFGQLRHGFIGQRA